ncbi:hypothetical protein TTHERM_00095580 (macronuclear) [Tetrahymena thermophila SB210]|uniref:Uncharacterized protein n=1 Tax=Tetrahymena thermophila (strain SB210) TaxID=312017 RepID=Q234Z1_TETTS|nr:hypothetical protein TTHERM_00095580 [Tetrahymena thermophila SB210]EAR91862.2 hypothetical protein TTHERM_00095580 [Tetrahymena thermophila SB210]|eukprot:XP_001012107.2 hypothetical protein TTHERM_00095580 [Tetrahymena thermophila SB210]
MSELAQNEQASDIQDQSNSTKVEKESIQPNQKREEKVDEQQQQEGEGEEEEDGEDEEYEDEEEEEFQIADFSKVEKAEKLIKHIMKDKELEYRFLLEIKSKNYDEAEFMAAKILAKDPNNETFLLFWDMLRKYKQDFYQMDEEEQQAEEEEEEVEEEEEWDEEEEVDEYDYNDGEEYEDEYEVDDDEDGWKTEDEYDTDELEDEEEEEEENNDEEEDEEEEEEEEQEGSEYEEEEEQENDEEIEKEQKDSVTNINLESQQLKKPVITKKKERNAKTELIQPFVQKQEIQSSSQKLDSKSISNTQKLTLKQSDVKSTNKQQIVLTKEVKPPLKPISGKQPGIKSQSISSAFDIKSKTTQFIPTTATFNNVKRPPSSSSVQSQNNNNSNRPPSSSSIKSANNYNINNRPPSSSSIQSAKEVTHKRNSSQSARDKKIPSLNSLGSDIQKLPPINNNNNLPTLGEIKKSISSISSASTQITTQKRPSSRDYRGSKSISTTNYK